MEFENFKFLLVLVWKLKNFLQKGVFMCKQLINNLRLGLQGFLLISLGFISRVFTTGSEIFAFLLDLDLNQLIRAKMKIRCEFI